VCITFVDYDHIAESNVSLRINAPGDEFTNGRHRLTM
jgi:hypothetical protein